MNKHARSLISSRKQEEGWFNYFERFSGFQDKYLSSAGKFRDYCNDESLVESSSKSFIISFLPIL